MKYKMHCLIIIEICDRKSYIEKLHEIIMQY